ncbi:MAG: hypothetical protein CRU78_01825 [Candidatus Accumulibacter phosphatis]|uniref:Ice-binding protein C-terminal domain-containing protein n=1 Tax=Candidatus Accumulibacter phosphatis TaxID=327160 RepID=A0A6A7RPW8_9PROT|nr:hypothetical protein [Candidatus Accumulibacter phosphatis]
MSAKHPSLTLKPALLAILLAFPAQQALAATCTWNGTDNNWATLAAWLSCAAGNGNPASTPGASDTANINAGIVTINTGQSILTLNNAGQINIDAFGLNLAGGGGTTNSGVINVGDVSTANLGVAAGHNINNTGGAINVAAGSVINQFGSTITGGAINTTGTGALVAFSSAANYLSGVTLNGNMDMATNGASRQRVVNGLTLGGATVDINRNGILSFEGTSTLAGTGTIVFGATGPGNRIALDGTGTTTFAAGTTVRGENGSIGQAINIGGTQTLVNDGTISADVAGGTITINAHPVTNNGTLSALNGGKLVLSSNVTGNPGGQIVAGAGSQVLQNGVTIGGTINTSGSGLFSATSNANNYLNGATLNGNLDMASIASSRERVTAGGLVLNGTVDINQNGILSFEGDGGLSGNGTVIFGNTGSGNRIALDGNGTTTFATGTTVRGHSGTIGQAINIGGTQTLVNDGTISADVAGGTITINTHPVTNNGTLSALNGGKLVLSSNVTGNPGGQIVAGAGSQVLQNGVTIGGTINTSGSGLFSATSNASNYLDGATLNGNLDMASIASSRERVTAGGLVLNGTVDINQNGILSFEGNGGLSGNGTVVFGATGPGNRIALDGTGTTTFAAGTTVRGQNGAIGAALNIGGTQTLVNNGLISADVATGTITISDSVVTNNSVLEARNGGTLVLASNVSQGASGQIQADGGVVRQSGMRITGGTIASANGGVLQVISSASNYADNTTVNGVMDMATVDNSRQRVVNGMTLNGTVNINKNGILSFEGTQTLGGSGSVVLGSTGAGNRIALDGTGTTTIASGVTVRGHSGSIGAALNIGGTQTLVNNGTINAELAGGTIGFNTSALVNDGLARAQAGTMNIGVPLSGTGTLQVDSTGTMNLANGAKTQGQLAMGAAGAALNLGTGNLTITGDYTNAGAGSGNSFNRRAGVTGTGLIVAGSNAAQAITGAGVTDGTSANATLTINNVRVGDTTFNYQIANTGTTGPALSGAVQTSVNGANLSDARLSGAGVTAGNYNTGAPGSSTADLGVTFSAASAGALAPLSGQVLNLRSNFENIADQKLNIVLASSAAAYNAAIGSAGSPVLVANQRVGGSNTATVTVSNTAAAGSFSEDLNVSIGGASGAASGSGSIAGRLAATSNTGTGAITARVDTTSAGAKTGNLTLDYQTAGAVAGVSNGLGTASVGNQVVTVSGDVYRLAQGAATPTPIVFANRHVDDSAIQLLTVQNTAAADGFSEKLNAGISSNGAPVTASGSVNLLAAQATNSSSLQVGIDTSSAGAKSGSATISYVSDGSGSSGLVAIAAGSQTINVSGDVYRLASANNLGAVAFGNVHVGDFVQQALSISNTALADGFSEKLNASFGASSDARITTSGSISQLAAQSTNSSSMLIGLDTAAAGNVNGTQVINFASDGTGTSGLGITALASQTIGVSGDITTSGSVFRLASASPATPNPVNFGALRIDSTAEQTLSITNTATDDGFSERLNASISSNAAPVTASGAFNLLAAQATNGSALRVGIDTSSAGAKSGSATIALVSDGDGTSGLGTTNLAPQTVNVSGDVYRLANPTLNTAAVTLVARRGDVAPSAAISVSNASPDSFTEGLKAGFASATPATGFGASGSIANLAAQGTDASSLQIALNTSSAGSVAGSAQVNFASTGAGTTGAADISVGSQVVSLAGKVYEKAVAQVNTALVNFGIVHKGDVVTAKNISVTNSAPVAALYDTLQGSFINMPVGPFGGSGSVSGLAAGQTDASSLLVSLDTTSAGVFTQGGDRLQFASHNADMADLGLGNSALTLQAQVNNYADPNFSKTSGTGLLSGGGFDFLLDFGTLTEGSGMVSALLQLANDVSGPADLLDGAYSFALNEFLKTGFDAFSGLGAGDSQSGLRISLDTRSIGNFSDTIVLAAVGHNGSGYSADFKDIRLTVQARVEAGGSEVPEPGTLLLLTIAMAIIVLQRRRGMLD